MRWITCHVCGSHHGVCKVFRELVICHVCRMTVIEYWKDILELTFKRHWFIDQFMDVESESLYQAKIRGFKNPDSDFLVDKMLDFGD